MDYLIFPFLWINSVNHRESTDVGEYSHQPPLHTHTDEKNDTPVSADIVLSVSMQAMVLSTGNEEKVTWTEEESCVWISVSFCDTRCQSLEKVHDYLKIYHRNDVLWKDSVSILTTYPWKFLIFKTPDYVTYYCS